MPGALPRKTLWIIAGLAGAAALVTGLAAGTGAGQYMAARMGPAWWLMPLLMIVVMALVMALMMMPMMSGDHAGAGHGPSWPGSDPLEVAARRYAAGELPREDYLRMKRDLGGGGGE